MITMLRRLSLRAPLVAATAFAALAAAPLAAQGVSTPAEADAEFADAMASGVRASTLREAEMCAGYWWALQAVHEASAEVPFWQNLPKRLGPDTATLGREFWNAVLREALKDDEARLEAAGNRVFDHRQEAIRRVVEAEKTGGIEGFFSTLGTCVPE
ncbi:MAG: hypothetical protein G9473_03140 [Erythrobacter sp.]|nr:MAG: hypothetical protein G9473_03140 [Erythrobacter sp.]